MSKRPSLTPLSACIAVAFSLGWSLANAATLHVTNCNDAGAGSLRDALVAAASGDGISFDSATMNCSTISLATGELDFAASDLSVTGPGATTLAIDGANKFRALVHQGTGTLSIAGLTIRNTYSLGPSGACISSNGNVSLRDSVLDNCLAYGFSDAYGGGIHAAHDLYMNRSTISNSSAIPYGFHQSYSQGGGAFVGGNAVVISSTLANNGSSGGGGLSVQTSLVMISSTLSGNYAGIGGALSIGKDATQAIISNSTISGNGSSQYCAVYSGTSDPTASVTIENSTIAFNTSSQLLQPSLGYAAGVCVAGPLSISSTIISNNTYNSIEKDFSAKTGATVTGSHNIVTSTVNSSSVPVDTDSGDPSLSPLANNGGPTQTQLPGAANAIDAGCIGAAAPAFDQRGRGFSRVWGAAPDIGATEAGSTGDVILRNSFEAIYCQ